MNIFQSAYRQFRNLFLPEGSLIVEALIKVMRDSPEKFTMQMVKMKDGDTVIHLQASGQIYHKESRTIQATRICISQHAITLDMPCEQGVALNMRDTYDMMQAVNTLLRADVVKVIAQ